MSFSRFALGQKRDPRSTDRVQLGNAIAKAKNAINSGVIAEGNVFIIDWHGNITVV